MTKENKKNDVEANRMLTSEEVETLYNDPELEYLKESLLISPNELMEIIKAGKKALASKPSKDDYLYANLYVKKDTYEEWKSLCDEQGMNYGPRVTVLMKQDIEVLKALSGQ